MNLLWVSIVLFALAWLPLSNIYSSTTIHYIVPYWFICASLLSGIVINIFALRSVSLKKFDKKYYLFFIPLSLSIYIIAFPFNLAFILLTLGLIILLFIRWANLFKIISIGLIYSGMVLMAQTIIIPFFT